MGQYAMLRIKRLSAIFFRLEIYTKLDGKSGISFFLLLNVNLGAGALICGLRLPCATYSVYYLSHFVSCLICSDPISGPAVYFAAYES